MKNILMILFVFALITVPALAAEDIMEARFWAFTSWPAGDGTLSPNQVRVDWGTQVAAGTPVTVLIGGVPLSDNLMTGTVYPETAAHYYDVPPGWCEFAVPQGTKTVDVQIGDVVFPQIPVGADSKENKLCAILIMDEALSFLDLDVLRSTASFSGTASASVKAGIRNPAADVEAPAKSEVTQPDPAEPEVATESEVKDEPVVTEPDPEPAAVEPEVAEPEVAAAEPEVTKPEPVETKADEVAELRAKVSALEAMLTKVMAEKSDPEPVTEEAPDPEPAPDPAPSDEEPSTEEPAPDTSDAG